MNPLWLLAEGNTLVLNYKRFVDDILIFGSRLFSITSIVDILKSWGDLPRLFVPPT